MNKQNLSILLLVLAAFGGLFFTLESQTTEQMLFNEWKERLGVKFDQQQNVYRFNIFKQNLKKINSHNSKLGKTYKEGLNQFAFLTQEQFEAQYLTKFETSNEKVRIEALQQSQPKGVIVDWVSSGAVTSVKNQGSCLAYYAFSAIGAIEGISYLSTKYKMQYSPQQLIDCSQPYGNSGCSSGNMVNSFKYIQEKGINTAINYPYTGVMEACKYWSGTFMISGYTTINDCTNLANALVGRPISVAVDGTNFKSYQSGIFTNCTTYATVALLLVGMTDQFWVLKNSWGTAWGEVGYIRLARGNTCGICSYGSYPLPSWSSK